VILEKSLDSPALRGQPPYPDIKKDKATNANNVLEQNIKKLLKGRIDIVIESHLIMEAKNTIKGCLLSKPTCPA